MIFNLITRPSPSEAYRFQQDCAHGLGLKTSVYIDTNYLDNQQVIDMVKADSEKYGDEVGIWLTSLPKFKESIVWLLDDEEKKECVKYAVDKFRQHFGYSPKSISAYIMDSHLMRIVKEYCPEVTVCIAGCFEEGVKVFHGCNNSWYLFSEGMCWNPWYPSKTQSIRPAENEEDWAGVVALPHLSRDLVYAYESRNDFFASHPGNVQRGLVNEELIHEYDYNLVDQYRMQEDFNDGFSYYQIHVSDGWLHGNPNVIDSDDITRTLYKETLEYMAQLRDEGKVQDMYLSEFAEYYKKNVPIGKANIAVGKDILFGSGKHYFWISNPAYRVLIDTFQGGSIGDLRPYAGKYESYTGSDSESLDMHSYPYVIQSQYRTGVKTHCNDGSRTTLLVRHNGEERDMCMYPSKVLSVVREKDVSKLELVPVDITFTDGYTVKIQTCYEFDSNGNIFIIRRILDTSDRNADLQFSEYLKGCYGFTEYPEKMKGILLNTGSGESIAYTYKEKEYIVERGQQVSVVIPQITTELILSSAGIRADSAEIMDGKLFSPFYTMKLNYKVDKDNREVRTCLTIKRMKV